MATGKCLRKTTITVGQNGSAGGYRECTGPKLAIAGAHIVNRSAEDEYVKHALEFPTATLEVLEGS
jgi:hypothetical protein